jgi:hypothetical protein
MSYTCHSGGCPGADMTWEVAGEEYGVVTHAYSFSGHVQYGKRPVILTDAELAEGLVHVQMAATSLHRQVNKLPNYILHLLCRNWFQVKHADALYAVGKFMDGKNKTVSGGTGWAVQMAIDEKKPIYFYDQVTTAWYEYDYNVNAYVLYNNTPVLTEQFAGVGTREITENGIQAILDVYKHTFSNSNSNVAVSVEN